MGYMKYVLILLVTVSLGGIIYGYTFLEADPDLAHKFIGLGTVGIFLVAMPLFLFGASRGKRLKDYMLNEENILRMRKNESEKERKKRTDKT